MLIAAGRHGDGNGVHACTQIGCWSGAELELGAFPESDVPRLTGARVEVCINSTCGDAVIAMLPPPNDVKTVRLSQPIDPRIEVLLSRTDPSGLIEIEINVVSELPEWFEDGDVYTVTLEDTGGARIAKRAWSVTCRTFTPNGSRCEPTCRQASGKNEL